MYLLTIFYFSARSMADGRMGGDEYSDYYGYNDYTNDTAMA